MTRSGKEEQRFRSDRRAQPGRVTKTRKNIVSVAASNRSRRRATAGSDAQAAREQSYNTKQAIEKNADVKNVNISKSKVVPKFVVPRNLVGAHCQQALPAVCDLKRLFFDLWDPFFVGSATSTDVPFSDWKRGIACKGGLSKRVGVRTS